jgi:deoxyribonuclease-4
VRGTAIGDVPSIRRLARELDVKLSVHVSYYIDLAKSEAMRENSRKKIKESLVLAHKLAAAPVLTHIGFYGDSKKETMERVVREMRFFRDFIRRKKLKTALAIEPSGRKKTFGTLDEILEVCRRVKGIVPAINFAHIHARTNGSLRSAADYKKILDKVNELLGITNFYVHFSGVRYKAGSEMYLMPIRSSDMKFEHLAECLAESGYDATIISSSPLLEHDAVYMKIIMEKVLAKYKGTGSGTVSAK